MSWKDRVAGLAGSLARTRGAILCFHGLDIDGAPSRSSMHVSHPLFESIVTAVRRSGTIVPLGELVTRHLAGEDTTGMVALTADDAYASWLPAEGLLRQLGTPITLFAVADALDSGRVFWWDRLEELAPDAAPERWRQFEDACGLPTEYRQGHAGAPRTVAMRQWLLAAHAGREPEAVTRALDQLESELGRRTAQRSMTTDELKRFMANTGAEVAVHTRTHAALPFLDDAGVVAEIREGYEGLQARLGPTTPCLAIPFGLFDQRTTRLAAEAGMQVALTLEGQPLDQRYALGIGMPRLCVVREQGPGVIALKLSSLAGVIERARGEHRNPYPVLPSATT